MRCAHAMQSVGLVPGSADRRPGAAMPAGPSCGAAMPRASHHTHVQANSSENKNELTGYCAAEGTAGPATSGCTRRSLEGLGRSSCSSSSAGSSNGSGAALGAAAAARSSASLAAAGRYDSVANATWRRKSPGRELGGGGGGGEMPRPVGLQRPPRRPSRSTPPAGVATWELRRPLPQQHALPCTAARAHSHARARTHARRQPEQKTKTKQKRSCADMNAST